MKHVIKKLFPSIYRQIRNEGYLIAMETYKPYYDHYQSLYHQSKPTKINLVKKAL